MDLAIVIKDFSLIKWIGANSFRTSHYPYSEEVMDEADCQGIVVIDECPAVGLTRFNHPAQLAQHKLALSEMIERDKNRPSVFMWSLANEPITSYRNRSVDDPDTYFAQVSAVARALDSRPLTATLDLDTPAEYMGKYLDSIGLNHYYGWYGYGRGEMQAIQENLIKLFGRYSKAHPGKPIWMSEYGSETIGGMHSVSVPYPKLEFVNCSLFPESQGTIVHVHGGLSK